MDRIPFKIVITGDVNSYNQEHAGDIIEEVGNDLIHEIHASHVTMVLQTGDNIRDICINVELPYNAGEEEIEKHYKEFIREILKDLEDVIPKPPALFDKTDYTLIRNVILERIAKWRKMDERWGYSSQKELIGERAKSVARKIVSTYYKGLAKEIIASAVTEEDIALGNTGDK